MAGPFEIATKAAIQEIMEKHVQSSKFGAFLSPVGQAAVIDEIYELLLTSRKLKSIGDRVLAGQLPSPPSARTANFKKERVIKE